MRGKRVAPECTSRLCIGSFGRLHAGLAAVPESGARESDGVEGAIRLDREVEPARDTPFQYLLY